MEGGGGGEWGGGEKRGWDERNGREGKGEREIMEGARSPQIWGARTVPVHTY